MDDSLKKEQAVSAAGKLRRAIDSSKGDGLSSQASLEPGQSFLTCRQVSDESACQERQAAEIAVVKL